MLRIGVRRKEGLPILLNLDELRNRAWYVHFEHMHREGKKVANALAKLMNSYFRDMVRCKTSPMLLEERIATIPSAGAAVTVNASAVGGDLAAASPAAVEANKEEKVEEKDDEDMCFSLFD
ncbi:hypothetical protein V6N13_148893 [Hibiscus sabdariffa]